MALRLLDKPKKSGIKPGNFKKLPETLTHYTNLNGLKGIIESRQIWASNVSFLNDRRELHFGLEATIKVIQQLATKSALSKWSKALKVASENLAEGNIPNTYAACFCSKSDVLSQWRGYGGTEQGVAIVFNRTRLAKSIKNPKASLVPIVYGLLEAKNQITKDLSDKLQAVQDDIEKTGDLTREQRMEEANSMLSRLLPQFKHTGFREEGEWRIVIQQKAIRSGVCFRVIKNVLVPYLEIDLKDSSGKLPISYLRVGPGADQELSKRSIELYLKKHGYEEVEVRVSNIPYRV